MTTTAAAPGAGPAPTGLSGLLQCSGMSLTEAARVTGVPEADLERLCRGQAAGIRFTTLAVVCAGLGCTPAQLLEPLPTPSFHPTGRPRWWIRAWIRRAPPCRPGTSRPTRPGTTRPHRPLEERSRTRQAGKWGAVSVMAPRSLPGTGDGPDALEGTATTNPSLLGRLEEKWRWPRSNSAPPVVSGMGGSSPGCGAATGPPARGDPTGPNMVAPG